jgi:hypothetical protein
MAARLAGAKRSTLLALAICVFAYLYVFPYYPRINNPNENVRFYMTAALVERGEYSIDSMRQRWGWVNDAGRYGGRLYSVKAPGTSLLGVPAYSAYLQAVELFDLDFDRTRALWLCRLIATILPTLFFLFFFLRWLGGRARHPALRDAVFISVALGSAFYGYGLLFVSHTVSAAAAFGAFMLIYQGRRRSERRGGLGRAFVAGLLTACVTLFEYPGLVASVALAAYGLLVLPPLKRRVAFALGGVAPAAIVMHFQWRAFGSPFTPGHLYVENRALREAHYEGLYGAVGPSWEAFHGLVLDAGAGLLPLTPILVLALVGFAALLLRRGERADAATALAVTLLTLLAICSMNNWRGGWTIGPRYLVTVIPFVAWGALEGLEMVAHRFPALAFSAAAGCTGAALAASGAPSAYYPHLPPEIGRPLPELLAVLIAHDYAPYNAGSLLNLYGTPSMWPLFAAAAAALLLVFLRVGPAAGRKRVLPGALLLCAALLWPLCSGSSERPAVRGARAFITRNWSPAGHDRAARLRAELGRRAGSDPDLGRRLADTYLQEGRDREAREVLER